MSSTDVNHAAMRAATCVQRTHAKRTLGWVLSSVLAGVALCPLVGRHVAGRQAVQRLDVVERALTTKDAEPLDVALSLRVQKLGPMLASWETIGGCGAGGTGGAGVGVKWIGRSTSGGLFQMISQANYVHFTNGYNFIASTQFSRDLSPKWQIGAFVPYVYKMYRDYLGLPVDLSNAGFGDVNVLATRRFGAINATSLTFALGLPTGTYNATYKNDPLTQEKQLGLGRLTGSLILDHTMDQTWGLVVVGGLLAYRGGENKLGNYRSPTGSLYSYAGYFMGPFVPVIGLSYTRFLDSDRDRTLEQDVPLDIFAANASIEWSNDLVAVLAGVSLPYSVRGTPPQVQNPIPTSVTGLQPWIVALGVSVSPF